MPNVNIHIPEVTQSVSRPVSIAIADQVKRITKIPNDTVIFYPGDSETISQSINGREAVFTTDKKLFIEVEETFQEANLSSTAISIREHPPVFIDPYLKVYVQPIYTTMNLVINFRYRSQSKTEITKWVNDIRIAISNNRELNIHDVSYHYIIPDSVFELLNVVHQLKERVAPYGENLTQYLTRGFSTSITKISDTIGNNSGYAIAETQGRILGMFEFQPLPEKPEVINDTSTYVASFSYKLTYEKPLALNVQYPIMVHNQLLPSRYVKFNTEYPDLDRIAYRYSVSGYALAQFEFDKYRNIYCDPRGVPRLPENDEFIPESVNFPGTISMFYALTAVETDLRTMLSLTDIKPLEIDSDILAFIKNSELSYINKPYKSIFIITIYKDDYIYSDELVSVDSTLTIRTLVDVNLRQNHRVELSVVTDFYMLDKDALLRLKKNPKVFFKMLMYINESFRVPEVLNRVKTVKPIDYQYLLEVFAIKTSTDITNYFKNVINPILITETNPVPRNNPVLSPNTIGTTPPIGTNITGTVYDTNPLTAPTVIIKETPVSTTYSGNTNLKHVRDTTPGNNYRGTETKLTTVTGTDAYGQVIDPYGRTVSPAGDLLNSYLNNLRFNNIQENKVMLTSVISIRDSRDDITNTGSITT